jgi:hypothetical protein
VTLRWSKEAMRVLFAALLGLFLMLTLIKWGNPVILDDPAIDHTRAVSLLDDSPTTNLRYWLLAGLVAGGIALAQWKTTAPRWILALPMVWLGWQVLASINTVDIALTRAALKHFAACAAFFYLGLFTLSQTKTLWPLLAFVLIGFLVVLWAGFNQHYGGLRETREFYQKLYRGEHPPEIQRQFDTPLFRQTYNRPEFRKRVESERIFGTVVYPNTFAGTILLLLPVCLATVNHFCSRWRFVFRGTLVGLLGYAGLASLYWSGSKAGWLIALALAFVAILQLPMQKKLKIVLIASALILGLAGFFVKFSEYFHRGAPSVGARLGYWRAAWKSAVQNPLLGTGPGTFSIPHHRLKAPDAEMARLVHNDFLEQASDSGWIGFLSYAALTLGTVVFLYRKRNQSKANPFFAIWLGLLGWILQSFVEFPLYIPAIAWLGFTFLGYLAGTEQRELQSTVAA